MQTSEKKPENSTKNHSYIIADHIRAASFIIAEGVYPSAKQRGYVLRRLIRRALASSVALNININEETYFQDLVDSVINIYQDVYDELVQARNEIVKVIFTESQKYQKAIKAGEKEWGKIFQKNQNIDKEKVTKMAWDLYQTHGVPFEVSESLVEQNGGQINIEELENLIESHQKLSQDSSKIQFKSGLAEDSQKTRSLHTSTHILHAVLRKKFGENVKQVGSAITEEKARFDVTLNDQITPESLKNIEDEVLKIINLEAEVNFAEMKQDEAKKLGAIGLFGEKYGDVVRVYTIKKDEQILSAEFCGGPHVKNTREIKNFRLLKVKSIGQGRKRFEFNVE